MVEWQKDINWHRPLSKLDFRNTLLLASQVRFFISKCPYGDGLSIKSVTTTDQGANSQGNSTADRRKITNLFF